MMEECRQNRINSNAEIVQGYHNCIKCSFSPAEKPKHRRLKYEICEFFYNENISFSTEVTFRNNKRCDILVKDWKLIIEILSSEKIKEFLTKSYPFPAIPMTTDVIKKDLYTWLRDLQTMNGKNWGYYYKKKLIE